MMGEGNWGYGSRRGRSDWRPTWTLCRECLLGRELAPLWEQGEGGRTPNLDISDLAPHLTQARHPPTRDGQPSRLHPLDVRDAQRGERAARQEALRLLQGRRAVAHRLEGWVM